MGRLALDDFIDLAGWLNVRHPAALRTRSALDNYSQATNLLFDKD
jgi:hypothetical protein